MSIVMVQMIGGHDPNDGGHDWALRVRSCCKAVYNYGLKMEPRSWVFLWKLQGFWKQAGAQVSCVLVDKY